MELHAEGEAARLGPLLRRVARLKPALNAFAYPDADGARAAARSAEAAVMRGKPLGPQQGVPVTVKDMMGVRGMPTRRGPAMLADAAPEAED